MTVQQIGEEMEMVKLRILLISCIIALISTFTVWADNWNVELIGRTLGRACDVHSVGNYAYLCAGGVLVILDVSDPSNPTKVRCVATPVTATGIYVTGSYAYVADHLPLQFEEGGLRGDRRRVKLTSEFFHVRIVA